MNQRKVNKAIYLILEKYHRLYGLKLVGFGGGHGYGYGFFYLDALGPNRDDYSILKDDRSKASLVMYLHNTGLPCWSHGEQLEFVGWQHARTETLVEWLLDKLSFGQLASTYSREIERWRSNYNVEQSEKYLLTMNLVGIYSARKKIPYTIVDAIFSDYDPQWPEKVSAIRNKLGDLNRDNVIWGDSELFFSENGVVLVNNQYSVDVWGLYVNGKSIDEILVELNDHVIRSKDSA